MLHDRGPTLSDIFISYARSTADQAHRVAEALRALGYGVWRDDELPAHRAYAEVIEERLKAAKAVVVIWSAEAVKSEWVQSEADRARTDRKLVQLSLDGATLPMPFDRIQCADLSGWTGASDAPGWRKVVASIAELVGAPSAPTVEASALSLPSKPSIAVMPFANLSSDPEQDYFADGMMDEIVTALTRNRSIFVIASGSTMALKGQAISSREVGRLLGVQYLLEGSVRQAGPRVRIAVKLIDASDGAQVWAERFDDTLEDVFVLQDKVALSVAGIIEPTVQDAEIRKLARRPTENPGSYDLYLRAVPLFWSFTKAEMTEAVSLLHQAIALDPDFGLAHALAATCHRMMFEHGWSDEPERHRTEGAALANRTLKLAADDARALAHAASALMGLEPTLDRSVQVIDRALMLNPGCAYAWLVSGLIRVRVGESELAIRHIETGLRLDPLSSSRPVARFVTAMAHLLLGHVETALSILAEFTEEFLPFHSVLLASALGHAGRIDEAREALARFTAVHARGQAQGLFHNPRDLAFFNEGIALAEGKSPAATDAKGE